MSEREKSSKQSVTTLTTAPERSDTALKVYFDATQTIRHYDGERTATHRLAVATLGALFAFTGSELFNQVMLPVLSVVGALLSLFFLVVTFKHSALIDRERARAAVARDLLSKLGDQTISQIDNEKAARYKKIAFSRIRTATLWPCMYLLFALSFVAITLINFRF
ncbi:hypothetical protein [Yoonia sp. R2-816]|uniref:hypothetical protein n=1 Tax=Yoonia sp. R2-816 TaxID=3342638 RepID=UPI003728C312